MTHIFEEQGQNILSLLCSNPLSLGLNIFKGLFRYYQVELHSNKTEFPPILI